MELDAQSGTSSAVSHSISDVSVGLVTQRHICFCSHLICLKLLSLHEYAHGFQELLGDLKSLGLYFKYFCLALCGRRIYVM